MEENKVKSGREILEEFFKDIATIENVDKSIANILADLYSNGKFTDKSIINELQKLRWENDKD